MSDREQQRAEVAPTAVEWAVRVVSVALLALLVGFLVAQGLRPDRPPTFTTAASVAEVRWHDGGYALPVTVRNDGTASVAELTVAVALRDGDRVVEEESIVVPLLGHGEEVEIVAWFGADPRRHTVAVDIRTFAQP